MKRALFLFDFDNTVINDNSDVTVCDLFKGGKSPTPFHPGQRWHDYMQTIFTLLWEEGRREKDYHQVLKGVKLISGMSDLFGYIRSLDASTFPTPRLAIVSDANSFFISSILSHHNLIHSFDSIYTNPAEFDPKGRLLLHCFHPKRHACPLSCPENFCKGQLMSDFLCGKVSWDTTTLSNGGLMNGEVHGSTVGGTGTTPGKGNTSTTTPSKEGMLLTGTSAGKMSRTRTNAKSGFSSVTSAESDVPEVGSSIVSVADTVLSDDVLPNSRSNSAGSQVRLVTVPNATVLATGAHSTVPNATVPNATGAHATVTSAPGAQTTIGSAVNATIPGATPEIRPNGNATSAGNVMTTEVASANMSAIPVSSSAKTLSHPVTRPEDVTRSNSGGVTRPDVIVYVGDGSNDYCPILRLSQNDLAFVRQGYSCHRLIKQNEKDVKCQWFVWECGEDIRKVLEKML